MKKTMVLYPALAVSHFLPMMKLADELVEHGYAVIVALIDPAVHKQIAFMATVDRVVSSKPSTFFHRLPRVELPRATTVLPLIRAESEPILRELGDTPLDLLGLPSMPASHLPGEMLEHPKSEIYKATMNLCHRSTQYSNGFLVNTFESLEARVVNALRDTRHHGGLALPPFYCIGPLVAGERRERGERHECLAWLDRQPDLSVVFLCFGSTGTGSHSEQQLREIAVGLEKSGHRFLWALPAPIVSEDPERPCDPRAEPDLDALLPAGFLERTSGRGAVVKLWAPQVDVIHHRATGAFVTHRGWNSVLEGITAAVPMLCWPLYAEQRTNKFLMVEEMGVAVEMIGWQEGLVTAEEVEANVRLVMESEASIELRARKEAAAVAWTDGASSRAAFAELLSDADSRQLARTS